jgi:hypothetical protein
MRTKLFPLAFILTASFALAHTASAQKDSTRLGGNGLHIYAGFMTGLSMHSLAAGSYYDIDNQYGSSLAAGVGLEYKRKDRYIVSVGLRYSKRGGTSDLTSSTERFSLRHNQLSIEIPLMLGYQFNTKRGTELLTLHAGGYYAMTSFGNTVSMDYTTPPYTYSRGTSPEDVSRFSAFHGSFKLSKDIARYKPMRLRLFAQGDFQLTETSDPVKLHFDVTGSPVQTVREVSLLSRSVALGIDLIF